MTAASGTPLILSVLAVGISFLSALGSIAAVLMARANLQRQIVVAAREAWMREFREQAAQHLTSVMRIPRTRGTEAQLVEIRSATLSSHVIKLLLAEKAPQYDGFERIMNRLLEATGPGAERASPERVAEFGSNAAHILRNERALIEAKRRMIPGVGAIGWRLWVSQQLREWLRRILTPPSRW